jgi:hypothetical protein
MQHLYKVPLITYNKTSSTEKTLTIFIDSI